jgi:ferredoxin-type protein NapH
MNSLNQKIGSRRKVIKYLRWSVKAAFLLIFVAPIKFFADSLCSPPVYSIVYGGFAQPLFTVPYGESVCSFLLLKWMDVGPGRWIVCPLGGSQVLATLGMSPVANPDMFFLLIAVVAAVSIFLLLVFLFGAMFCSWVCPVGTAVDSFDKAVERFMPKLNKRREERLRQSRKKEEQIKQNREKRGSFCPTCFLGSFFDSKHASVANGIIITALVGSAIFRFPIFCSICPIGVLSRGMFHLKAWTNLLGERFLNVKGALGVSIDMPVIVEFYLIIPLVAVFLSLREKRFWCRKICPVGALIRLGSKLNSFLKPVKADNCLCPPDHKACQKVCPQGSGPQKRGSAECTKCFECYATCKNNNVKIKRFETPDAVLSLKRFFKKKMKKPMKVQETEAE